MILFRLTGFGVRWQPRRRNRHEERRRL